jgi:hypothetical protein
MSRNIPQACLHDLIHDRQVLTGINAQDFLMISADHEAHFLVGFIPDGDDIGQIDFFLGIIGMNFRQRIF